MSRSFVVPLGILVLLASLGCYHAVIDTGRAPNGVRIEKKWAHSFIAGLVPPSVVETARKCPDGIAKVETRLGFLNQLANFLTLGIYSPMEIVVSCAGSAPTEQQAGLTAGDTDRSRMDAMRTAIDLTLASREPIYVRF